MAQYLDIVGVRHLIELFVDKYNVNRAISFKGSSDTISTLPHVADCQPGELWVVILGGTTTNDFSVGPGKHISDGTSLVATNVSSDPGVIVMKWDIIGDIFDISNKLSYGTSFPPSPSPGEQFLYVGPNVFSYEEVIPEGTENPAKEGWFVYDATTGGYKLSDDVVVNLEQTYYKRHLIYQSHVVYEYRSELSAWVAQTDNDRITSISSEDIESLFS